MSTLKCSTRKTCCGSSTRPGSQCWWYGRLVRADLKEPLESYRAARAGTTYFGDAQVEKRRPGSGGVVEDKSNPTSPRKAGGDAGAGQSSV